LQVEHPVTEMITGQDLVEWQLRVAAGEPLPVQQEHLQIDGHAVEVRLYAEDPAKGFLPSTGTLRRLRFPPSRHDTRVDTGVREGDAVTMYYDPMIAKLIAWGQTRDAAILRLVQTLSATEAAGLRTNLSFLIDLLSHPAFKAGEVDTGFIDRHHDVLFTSARQAPPEARILCALEQLLGREQSFGWASDPWNAGGGWRLGPAHTQTIAFADGERLRCTPIGRNWLVHWNEMAVQVSGAERHDGRVTAMLDGRRASAAVLHLQGEELVLIDGRGYSFALRDPLGVDLDTGASALTLMAPMPGKVVSVFAKAGDPVRKGQPIAVLEAMKMEHTLAAPADLVVESLNAAPGEQISEGTVVVRFKAAAAQ
ncbi:MAG TPA: 3-methylcrotonyl-CoA carboxylase, partial [Alphaproteobacteria bacterium]|nr:3-methylcrotonyl-CoA carboxylase [Alphaproteobacteria bacterium]